ncbi:hypothetical protein MSG28_013611 [Choristoneura fumiferana]|uniref:Uncharacterized protein n=1 Tax=Choristoneura fumiferana TaxID=7141 RepID=A0ACC0K8N4_CHOFU|nr:hypothetical protein MSG28_013611 [Choristoneura fumiferana]
MYMEDTWLRLGPEKLSCSKDKHRTNDPVEGWHRRLNIRMPHKPTLIRLKQNPLFLIMSVLKRNVLQDIYDNAFPASQAESGDDKTRVSLLRLTQLYSGPVGIVLLDSTLKVSCNESLLTKNIVHATVEIGALATAFVGVYMEGDRPIDGHLNHHGRTLDGLATPNVVLAGDVNAASHWWGCGTEDRRGADLVFSSIVDITACSATMLTRVADWRVVTDDAGLSDHRRLAYTVETEVARDGGKNWQLFAETLTLRLAEAGLTAEALEDVEEVEHLEDKVTTFTGIIRQACDASIPRLILRAEVQDLGSCGVLRLAPPPRTSRVEVARNQNFPSAHAINRSLQGGKVRGGFFHNRVVEDSQNFKVLAFDLSHIFWILLIESDDLFVVALALIK